MGGVVEKRVSDLDKAEAVGWPMQGPRQGCLPLVGTWSRLLWLLQPH